MCLKTKVGIPDAILNPLFVFLLFVSRESLRPLLDSDLSLASSRLSICGFCVALVTRCPPNVCMPHGPLVALSRGAMDWWLCGGQVSQYHATGPTLGRHGHVQSVSVQWHVCVISIGSRGGFRGHTFKRALGFTLCVAILHLGRQLCRHCRI